MGYSELWASDARIHAVLGVASAFIVLSWLTVALRVYVRGFMIRSLGWDDWLMLATLAFHTSDSAFLMLIAVVELKSDPGIAELGELSKLTRFYLLEVSFYIVTSLLLKLSLAVFFLRVVLERWQRRVIWISVAIYAAFALALLFVAVFECGDPTQFFIHEIEGKCLSWTVLGPMSYIHSILNAIVDWIFALLPILVIRRTNMPKQARVSVSLILVLGALGSVASVVRIAYVDGLHPTTGDFFVQSENIALASNLELGLGIIAGSLATLRPLLRVVLEKSRHSWLSPDHTHEHNSTKGCKPPSGESKMEEVNHKQQDLFASYGFSADSDNLKSMTITTTTGNSLSEIAMEPRDMSNLAGSSYHPVFPPPPAASDKPGSRKASQTSARMSFSSRKQSQASRPSVSQSSRKASQGSSRRPSRKEAWEDLEAAKSDWHERISENGTARVEPNLLLPDPALMEEDDD